MRIVLCEEDGAFLTTERPACRGGLPILRLEEEDCDVWPTEEIAEVADPVVWETAAAYVCRHVSADSPPELIEAACLYCSQWPEGPQPLSGQAL